MLSESNAEPTVRRLLRSRGGDTVLAAPATFHGPQPLIALAMLALGSHPPQLPGRN